MTYLAMESLQKPAKEMVMPPNTSKIEADSIEVCSGVNNDGTMENERTTSASDHEDTILLKLARFAVKTVSSKQKSPTKNWEKKKNSALRQPTKGR